MQNKRIVFVCLLSKPRYQLYYLSTVFSHYDFMQSFEIQTISSWAVVAKASTNV